MRIWSEILRAEATLLKYSITIDLSCTTCEVLVQNGLRDTDVPNAGTFRT
jgi:hypothetical protein